MTSRILLYFDPLHLDHGFMCLSRLVNSRFKIDDPPPKGMTSLCRAPFLGMCWTHHNDWLHSYIHVWGWEKEWKRKKSELGKWGEGEKWIRERRKWVLSREGERKKCVCVRERERGKREGERERGTKNPIYNLKWGEKNGISLRNWKAIFLRPQIKINSGPCIFGSDDIIRLALSKAVFLNLFWARNTLIC